MTREISRDQVSLVLMTSCARSAGAAARINTASFNCLLSIAVLRLLRPEQITRIYVGVERNLEEPEHHLFPALISIANLDLRIGVTRVVSRVVIPGSARDSGSFRQEDRRCRQVRKLPTEAIVGHFEK